MELTQGKTIAIMPKSAGTPQPQDQTSAGRPVEHVTQGEVISIATLGGVGANVVMSVINLKRTNDVKTLVTTANQNAANADADAIKATAAANNAAVAAAAAQRAAQLAQDAAIQACLAASPTDPNCGTSITVQ